MMWLDDIVAEFSVRVLAPFMHFAIPSSRIFVVFLGTALLIAFAVFCYQCSRSASDKGLIRGFLRYCFPKSVYWHPSARLDYMFFILNRILFPLLFAPLILSEAITAEPFEQMLTGLFGDSGVLGEPGLWATVTYTLAVLLVGDGVRFAAHYLQHRVPALWEFHKIHHSAEVLTPITVYRMHPVDDLLVLSMLSLSLGTIGTLFAFLFEGPLVELTIWGTNLGYFAFYVFGYNLRHTHIWLPYPQVLSHVFISPAQHQIHHSAAPRHFDKNFGFMFAFWDWMAGSLYVPARHEAIEFGLSGEDARHYDSLWHLYWCPFVRLRDRYLPGQRSSERP